MLTVNCAIQNVVECLWKTPQKASKAVCSIQVENVVFPTETSIKMSQVIQSNHINKYNVLDGGQLLKWVDTCACLSAERLAGHPCVTVSVDDLYFESEVELGQIINLHAQVNRAFTTSMEVGIKVSCESLKEKKHKTICEAFLTFVALDDNNKKVALPRFSCQTAEERERFSLASERRKLRIQHAKTMKSLLHEYKLSPMDSRARSQSPNKDVVFPSNVVHGGDTKVESVELVLPPHANHHGNTFGGQVMSWMENVASISAGRLCRGFATLRSVDMVYFRGPSTVGDRIVLRSVVNNVFQNSLEVGVRVEAYRYKDGKIGERRHINSAFLTYEVRDESQNNQLLPQFVPEPVDGQRRQKEAAARRKIRFDRRYILSLRRQDRLSVKWNKANAMYLCYGNVTSLTRISSRTDWQVASSTETIVLSTREESGVLSLSATLKLIKPLKVGYVFSVLKSVKARSEWDPLFLSEKLIERISDEDAIYRTVVKNVTSKSENPNDFVLLVSDRKPSSPNEPYQVAIRSVAMKSVPPVEGFSRTEVACAGFVARHQDGICTNVTYYNEMNPKLVSYISSDMAGLSKLHCHILNELHGYLYKNA
uniref:Acyl-coenzyme A thioesterase 11-like n=1 Tax=Phallusia mammillata TaxID=59560 RepID=A0A6F9D6B2_9ASCI|nr:acyl-coenzyme A thioesterase 11-like [Phallusia mammillata]